MNGGDHGRDRSGVVATKELDTLVQSSSVTHTKLAALLDGYDSPDRVAATRGLPRRALRRLYNTVEVTAALSVDDFVPAHVPPYATVRHFGTNSLPTHRCFEKVMYRQPDGHVGGRNVQGLAWLTGHGYFVVQPSDDPARGQVQLNYTALPGSAPTGWPSIRDNRRGLSVLVYGGMVDYMRRVSAHVTIGRAVRNGQPMDTFFLLVRDDALETPVREAHEPARVVEVA